MEKKLKKLGCWPFLGIRRTDEGRGVWPSRAAFILAGIAAVIGMGNLLRYPAVAFRNFGLQWFFPYLVALVFIGVPILLLEVAIGQAYRVCDILAMGRISPLLRGLGAASLYISFIVACYYVTILAWVMVYLRNCFLNPLPWKDKADIFFAEEVAHDGNQDRQSRSLTDETDDDPRRHLTHSATMGWETFGWSAFTFIIIYMCLFRGVDVTGRVVYVTVIMPLVMLLILTIRAVTLENAWNGIQLYVSTFNASRLMGGQIWQDAIGQVFFSINVGFGILTAYASYNKAGQNVVQDTCIIAASNCLIEMMAGLAAFGVIGYLDLPLDNPLSTFSLGFFVLPEAIAELPGSNVWAFFFFLMLFLLGIDSAFAVVEVVITTIADSYGGRLIPRSLLTLFVCFVGLLFALLYSSYIGAEALDKVDKYTTQLGLLFVTWAKCVGVNIVYRWRKVVSQVGFGSFLLFNMSYVGAQVTGVLVYHLVSAKAAAATYVGMLVSGLSAATILAHTPHIAGPWGSKGLVNRFWWLSWEIPWFWAPLLRWVTAPILLFTLSFVIPHFIRESHNPVSCFAFFTGLASILMAIGGLIFMSFSSPCLPPEEERKGTEQYTFPPKATVLPLSMPTGGSR